MYRIAFDRPAEARAPCGVPFLLWGPAPRA
jgi:hypothetical protein